MSNVAYYIKLFNLDYEIFKSNIRSKRYTELLFERNEFLKKEKRQEIIKVSLVVCLSLFILWFMQ